MNTKIKRKMHRLLNKHKGDKEEVAKQLGISTRYVYMLLEGKQPGKHLAKFIQLLS